MLPNQKVDHMYDANRNHVVPYYYSETLTPCMPNNAFVSNKNRHTLASYPYDNRQNYYRKIKAKSTANTPELSVFKAYQQPYRPYSVLETTSKSPVAIVQRPSSVVPMTISDQYKPASFFISDTESKKSNEVPEWKAKLQAENSKPLLKGLEKPLRPICKIPNCKCAVKVDPLRYSEVRTLPTVSERSLSKIKNLSLPTLKLEDLDKIEKYDQTEAERDIGPTISKPVSEQHLGYV